MNELFYNISEKNKEKLLTYLEAVTYKYAKNKRILNNLISNNFICIILKGSIEITRIDVEGNKRLIDSYETNSLFCSLSYSFKNEETEITTKEETKIIINENKLSIYNTFLKNLTIILSKIIVKSNERIEVLSNKSIRDKLLDYFKIQSKKNNSKVIYLPVSYTELADYLAVNRSALSREIKNLKDDGLIETRGRRIKLLYYLS